MLYVFIMEKGRKKVCVWRVCLLINTGIIYFEENCISNEQKMLQIRRIDENTPHHALKCVCVCVQVLKKE